MKLSGLASRQAKLVVQRDQLVEILNTLPLLDGHKDKLRQEAYSLLLSSSFASLNDRPRSRNAGPAGARWELDTLAKLSFKLGKHILSMHRDALGAIETAMQDNTRHPLDIVADLRMLISAIGRAEDNLNITTPATGSRKCHAQDVTDHAASVFERLTGRRATRTTDGMHKASGRWLSFLRSVFQVLNVKASAESQAKAMEKRRQK